MTARNPSSEKEQRAMPVAPVLALLPHVLSGPSPVDLDYIAAEMLWPEDPEWRERAIKASVLEWAQTRRAHMADGEWRETAAGLFDMAKDAVPIETIRDELYKERRLRGCLVGRVLHKLLLEIERDPKKANKQKVIKECIDPFQRKRDGDGGLARLSVSHFNTEIWPQFESVAHLWAASNKFLYIDRGNGFPCTIETFARFLADAEFYRIRGEKARTWKSPTTVLQPEKTMKLPDFLKIAPSNLRFRSG